ncbi:dihydrodipicolinate synthase family protein [uncultured Paludibaculum sp.]|uniref:dihydrodipicolinate synthase family protein n=1 Tax=uncultured Paludibaculum sp. TaxID=1765020 RepID=UPI002AAA6EF5|nr:dihydrodipicolinate synthase family protein [uncultured Paludibaculum sp.]
MPDNHLYNGIIPPLVTPLLESERLDVGGLERLIERAVAGGVDGFFLLGTTGEAPNLSHRLQREFIKQAIELIDGRKPALIGITDCCLTEALDLSRYGADCGATAVVFAPPYYYPLSQEELLRYSLRLVDALPLPFFLYNIPSHTRNTFERSTARVLSHHPNCLGIKDSSGDWPYFSGLIEDYRDRSDFAVLMGPEEMLADAVLAGAAGGVSGGANLYPKLYVDTCRAAREGKAGEARSLQATILRLSDKIYGPAGYLRGMKCALELAGVCSGVLTEPFAPLEDEQRASVRAALIELGLL